jgi:hypothetical protein
MRQVSWPNLRSPASRPVVPWFLKRWIINISRLGPPSPLPTDTGCSPSPNNSVQNATVHFPSPRTEPYTICTHFPPPSTDPKHIPPPSLYRMHLFPSPQVQNPNIRPSSRYPPPPYKCTYFPLAQVQDAPPSQTLHTGSSTRLTPTTSALKAPIHPSSRCQMHPLHLLWNTMHLLPLLLQDVPPLPLVFPTYFIQHCFICRLSDSTVTENAGFETRGLLQLWH